jgi:hypothetical protein
MDKGIVEHLIPGRIRLRFRQQRGNEDLFRSLVARLVGHPGVQSVRPNPSTGSLFIFHEGNCAPEWRGKTAARRALTPPNGEYAPARNPRFLGAALSQLILGRVSSSASQHSGTPAWPKQSAAPPLPSAWRPFVCSSSSAGACWHRPQLF